MTGKTHMLGGLAFGCAGVIAASAIMPVNPIQAGSIIMGSTVGALIPDIDHPNSMISRKIPLISLLYRGVAFIDKQVCKLLKIQYHMGHRGITHSIIPTTLLLAALFIFGMNSMIFPLLLGLIVGAYSHIFLDMLNPSGVPIFLPFNNKRYRVLPKKLAIPTKNMIRNKGTANKAWKENAFAASVLLLDALMLFSIWKGVI